MSKTALPVRCVLFVTVTAAPDIPVFDEYPAALLPLGWSSVLERVVEQLSQFGMRQIDVVVSARPQEVRRLLGQGERWGVQLRWHLAKDATKPYGVLRTLSWAPHERVLLGYADRYLNDDIVESLLQYDQMLGTVSPAQRLGMEWAGWGSASMSNVPADCADYDEATMGRALCEGAPHILLIDDKEWLRAGSAQQLLQAQRATMSGARWAKIPASWVQTPWGARSPDAVVQPGAQIEGPVLVGPGCLVNAQASLGPGTVLTRDVVISDNAIVSNSLVFPQTFVGQGLGLQDTVVNGRTVQHIRLGVRTVLPAAEGLLLDLGSVRREPVGWLSRLVALCLCTLFLPWLALDACVRKTQGLPLRWEKRQVVRGQDLRTQTLKMQILRCAPIGSRSASHWLVHYGAWLDVVTGQRAWFGSRPRTQEEWALLGSDWQQLLSSRPIGCLHAPAWVQDVGENTEAYAVADVFFAVNHGLAVRWRIVKSLLRSAISVS